MCFRTDVVAGLVLEQRLEVPEEIVCFRGSRFVSDVVGGVVVHAVEVVGALHQGEFGGREFREARAELGEHGGWVVAVVDGVCEPGDAEFEFAFCGFDV